MGRPRRGAEPLPVIRMRMDPGDWSDLDAVTGGGAAETMRQLAAWWLRRPGARMPARPAQAALAAIDRDGQGS